MRYLATILATITLLVTTTLAWTIPYPEDYQPYYNEQSATALAKLVWAEARGLSDTETSAVMWVVINRTEKEGCWGSSLWETLTQKGQFAYKASSPVDPHLYNLAKDVLIRWDMERCGIKNVGRTIPGNYYYFTGDGTRNYFRAEYGSNNYWDWSLKSPYKEG